MTRLAPGNCGKSRSEVEASRPEDGRVGDGGPYVGEMKTAGWGWLLHPGGGSTRGAGYGPPAHHERVGDPQIFSEAWVRWAVWFDTGLRGTPARLTTNGSSASDRFGTGSPRTGWAGGEDCAEDGRVGDAATGKGRVERAEELERTGNRRPIGDAAPTRERMRRGGG